MDNLPDVTWDGQTDYCDFLCRNVPPRQFAVDIETMNYTSLRKIQSELDIRIRNMRNQIDTRASMSPNPEWLKKVNVALSISLDKLWMTNHRIRLVMANAIQEISQKSNVDPRIDLIRGLISFIDNRFASYEIPRDFLPLIDSARLMTDSSMISEKFTGQYFYDPDKLSIVDEYGITIAYIAASGVLNHEIGRIMAASTPMLNLILKFQSITPLLAGKYSCARDGHNPDECPSCMASAILEESADLVRSLK